MQKKEIARIAFVYGVATTDAVLRVPLESHLGSVPSRPELMGKDGIIERGLR